MTTGPSPRMPDRGRRPPSILRALSRVLSASGFPYGSNYQLFRDAHFGRDSLEVAEDLLQARPTVARAVISRLACLQGRRYNPLTEEEPGKIHHEYRALVIDGRPVTEESRRIFRQLARYWNLAQTERKLEALREITYYATVDATPLFVRLVYEYCEVYGYGILEEEIPARDGGEDPGRHVIREAVRRAVDWIVSKLTVSDLGLLEFQRMTPRGHRFQAWKDGGTSYLHTDGRFANYLAPMASIEVQGLAYDALMAAPSLLADAPPPEKEGWQHLAERLQRRTLSLFWMEDERYFSMAVDRDPTTGAARQVKLISSNPGALLDSRIFDALPEEERQQYVRAIVGRVYGEEMLTPVGVRCSSLAHQDLLDYPAYQSSHTVWHKETNDIARGLRRQGLVRLAEDLENRLLNGINLTGGPTEFLYVLPDNRVDYDPLLEADREGTEEIAGTNVPENEQAWTISAALRIKWQRGRRAAPAARQERWQTQIEDEISSRIPPVQLLRTLEEIERARPTAYSFVINTRKGCERERAFVIAHEL